MIKERLCGSSHVRGIGRCWSRQHRPRSQAITRANVANEPSRRWSRRAIDLDPKRSREPTVEFVVRERARRAQELVS